jgi:hypothetical protein
MAILRLGLGDGLFGLASRNVGSGDRPDRHSDDHYRMTVGVWLRTDQRG